MLTTKQAAESLNVGIRRVQQAIKFKQLKAEKFGRDWLISEDELERFRLANRKPGNPGTPRKPKK